MGRLGALHDPLGEENLNRLLQWLLRWRRGLLPRGEGNGCRAGGRGTTDDGSCGSSADDYFIRKRVWIARETLWLGECGDPLDEEEASPVRSTKEKFCRDW